MLFPKKAQKNPPWSQTVEDMQAVGLARSNGDTLVEVLTSWKRTRRYAIYRRTDGLYVYFRQ